jgi:hypothetical protein
MVVINNECNYTCHFPVTLTTNMLFAVTLTTNMLFAVTLTTNMLFAVTFVNEQPATDSRLQAMRYTN